ncbi:helix-turn-helix domain-containing protein [Streptomyces sp. NPDC002671]
MAGVARLYGVTRFVGVALHDPARPSRPASITREVIAARAVIGQPRGMVTTSPVGLLVRRRREHRRRSQLDVAVAANLSTRHLSYIETGRATPSRNMIATPGIWPPVSHWCTPSARSPTSARPAPPWTPYSPATSPTRRSRSTCAGSC